MHTSEKLQQAVCRALIVLTLLLAAVHLQAQGSGDVVINGTVVMRFQPERGEDCTAKVEAVTKRLEDMIRKGASAREIVVRVAPGEAQIYWGKTLICVVDQFQSKMNNTTPAALAHKWCMNLIAACGEQALRTSVKTLTVPVGEEHRFVVKGGGHGDLQLTYDQSLLLVRQDPSSGEICVSANAAGNYAITLQRGTARGMVRVCAKDWAGKILAPVERIVSGDPVSPELQLTAALTGLNEGIQAMPGTRVMMKEYPRIETALKQGFEREVKIPILMEGKGYFPVEGNVKVMLKNQEIAVSPPATLMLSNRPETIEEDGILFKGRVSLGSPARLLYSHKNGSSGKRKLWITLGNPSGETVRLFISNASAGPDKFEIQTGHKAAMRYLENFRCRAGYVLEIAPRKTIILDEFDIASQFIVSSICDLQLLDGKDVEVEVKTSGNPGARGEALKLIEEPFDPFKIHPHGIFPSPLVELQKTFNLSGENISIEVGKWPWLIDGTTGEPNTGNYGVFYKIKVSILNDTKERAQIAVSFIPRNGISMGSVLIDGTLLETGIIKQEERTCLTKIEMAPGENRLLEIVTFPEAGSCYPVNIEIGRTRSQEITEK